MGVFEGVIAAIVAAVATIGAAGINRKLKTGNGMTLGETVRRNYLELRRLHGKIDCLQEDMIDHINDGKRHS